MTTKYPAWAPKELREYHKKWESESPDMKNEAFCDLAKLVTDERMEPIWEELEKLATSNNVQRYYLDFLVAIQPNGPFGIDRLTKAELRDAVKNIEKKSRELRFLVNRVMPFAFINDAPKSLDNLVIDVLDNLGAQAREVINEQRTISRPGEKRVKTIYFVRQLSVFFKEMFDNSMNTIVAELHSIFLPDEPKLNSDNVRSILRNSPK